MTETKTQPFGTVICELCQGSRTKTRPGFAAHEVTRKCELCKGRGWLYRPAYELAEQLSDARRENQTKDEKIAQMRTALAEAHATIASLRAASMPTQKAADLDWREIAHALWYEGGRLRTNLSESVFLHPENWHVEAAKQRIAEWDKAVQRYFDFAIAPIPAPPESKESE